MAFIEVTGLRKVYRLGQEKVYVLKKVDLRIERGEICCILGTSGSGKSTLLNMLAGLEKPTRGSIVINGTDIAKLSERRLAKFRQENTGFIFQSYNLLPQLTSLENVGMPLMFKGMSRKKRDLEARAMLKAVGLGSRAKHRPNQMSGGQQQRVGIARAFVAKPNVIFADEPTGNLDTKTTADVMALMVRMCRTHGLTLILVTHDPDTAKYADRIVHLIDGEIHSDEINPDVYDPDAPEKTNAQERETEREQETQAVQ
ncbi:MAG: ABC transporter ATP-binding protein [Bacteroides sp.]|nr:ABC transporter ATP-binding protein [Eubacterium sp.]MCM1417877.1 ABC transporter ATP-binding protein [Roseburia sp.]MCM1461316.1 ABC transporter ATP-binding protein [Bacteroides sp.]